MDNINVTADVIANVNRLLAEGKSLNQLDKTDALLNLSRKAFRNRAMKENYFFNQDKRQFELKNKDIEITPDNTDISQDNIKETQDNTDKKIIKELLQRIEKLESIVLSPDNPISNFKIDDRVKDLDDIFTRSFRVSKDAVAVFDSVCDKKLYRYQKQQLLSQALYEFADRYK